ncbi:MAG: hypothetical protein H7338_01850 [Candidatus Sericytochromatia bacterium]|nr:hypothetical protein [Candidatus Sericytochromatia bacterium]
MKRHVKVSLLLVTAILVLGIAALRQAYIAYQQPLPPITVQSGRNALWMRHAWVGQPHSGEDVRQLALMLQRHRITDIFVHVGPLDGTGAIDPAKYPHAAEFIQRLKADHSQVCIQAWVGQIEKGGAGPLDLSNGQVRTTIIGTAKKLLTLGFDGIHYNIEPIVSGNPHFVALLRDTHTVTQALGKIESVSGYKVLPLAVGGVVSQALSRATTAFWDPTYCEEVAGCVDQLAVMMYDTALPYDFLYGRATADQIGRLTRLLGARIPLFIGVPTYEDQRWTFHAEAENMESGLRGIRQGIAGIAPDAERNVGVAIYADWTTDPAEWETYRRLWLPPG